jgi:hypothetical protein
MNIIREISEAVGLRQTPWVIRAYITLLGACIALMVFALLQAGGSAGASADKVLTLSMDSFKIVLGACIGSLSMAASATWGGKHKSRAVADDRVDE